MSRFGQASQRGASLVSVLVGAGLVGVLALVGAKLTTNLGAGTRRAELRGEREILKSMIFSEIDCAATFANAGINPAAPGAACGSTSAPGGQVGPFLRLARSTANGTLQFLSGPLSPTGTAQIGDWTVRASCSAAEQTLVVRAARPLPGGNFARDPLNETIVYDWNEPRGLLYGSVAGGSLPLCFGRGGPLTTQSGVDVANVCNGTNAGGLCSSGYYRNITFPVPFSAPPRVIVSPNYVSFQSGCVGGATDQVRASASLVTATGFRMWCSGSPETGTCGAYEGWTTRGRCNWLAIGPP